MVTKIVFEEKVIAKLEEFCVNTIGRRPFQHEITDTAMIIFFDPPLTTVEKQTLNNALPGFVKRFWKITVSEV